MSSPHTLGTVLAASPAPALRIHAGSNQKTFEAARDHGAGLVVWKGSGGAGFVVPNGSDPVTGGQCVG